MVSSEKKQVSLKRIKGVVYFFSSFFLALLAIAAYFEIYQYPDNEAYLNLGFKGVIGSLLAVGFLKLAQAITGDGASILMRLFQGSIFLLCLCAALGTVGFYSVEILGLSGGLSLLGYGLLASSMILILTGTIKLGEAYATVCVVG
ncbi:MAG: hypothetical protein GVY25_00490 [Bacteroidetes bacterium]|jgi:hypothetical protein|nr:hypothetical protein [Bacteroidota bacterium]